MSALSDLLKNKTLAKVDEAIAANIPTAEQIAIAEAVNTGTSASIETGNVETGMMSINLPTSARVPAFIIAEDHDPEKHGKALKTFRILRGLNRVIRSNGSSLLPHIGFFYPETEEDLVLCEDYASRNELEAVEVQKPLI